MFGRILFCNIHNVSGLIICTGKEEADTVFLVI